MAMKSFIGMIWFCCKFTENLSCSGQHKMICRRIETKSRRYQIVVVAIFTTLFLNSCASLRTQVPPTPSPEPTATTSTLSLDGPWLLINDDSQTYAANVDGSGLTLLLSDFSIWTFENPPTSSTIAAIAHKKAAVSYNLLVFNLPSNKVEYQIPLLSFYKQQSITPDGTGVGPLSGIMGSQPGNSSIRWSPDGRYLAFMGAIDSPTSSLYVYDQQNNVAKKLAQNTYHAVNPVWSPDGQWIIYEEVSNFHGWLTEGIWAVKADGSKAKLLYKPENSRAQEILGWVGNNQFVVFDRTLSLGEGNVRMINLETGDSKELYSGVFFSIALDNKNGAIAFSPYPGAPGAGSDLEMGIYLVSPDTTTPQLISPDIRWVSWDNEKELFISDVACTSNPEEVIAFNSSGVSQCISPKKQGNRDYISPDQQLYLDTSSNSFSLYQTNGELVGTVEKHIEAFAWSPNSQGIIFSSSKTLFYLSLPTMDIQEIYRSQNDRLSFRLVGVP
jgi:Tol biopolymer transport system component